MLFIALELLTGSNAQALWARRLADVGSAFATDVRVRAYGNSRTLGNPTTREALESVGVDVIEVRTMSEAADELLMSDVYCRARDAHADGVASTLATMVITSDVRLSLCVEQALVRGVRTVVVSDYLRTYRSKPEFRHLFTDIARNRWREEPSAYNDALRSMASWNGYKMFTANKLARAADVSLIWDPHRVLDLTRPEREAHNRSNGTSPDDFGQLTSAPGGVVAILRPRTLVAWPRP